MSDASLGGPRRAVVGDAVSVRGAVVATGVALGLGATQRAITAVTGWDFPSWQETVVQVARDVGLLTITALGFRSLRDCSPLPEEVGLPGCCRVTPLRVAAATVLLGLTGAGVTVINSEMSFPLVLATVLVRWPVSVVAQQVLFFGWLQPRLAASGLTTAALLYAGYHLYDPVTAAFVLPLGFAFAYLRQRSGTIYPGIALHWLAQLGFQALS
jgi:membrane protease YdiL (CAAX protease family)